MLDMGPVLPDTPEGDVQEVTVLNEGIWDVEIFSLDFDKVTARPIGKHLRDCRSIDLDQFLFFSFGHPKNRGGGWGGGEGGLMTPLNWLVVASSFFRPD